MPVAPPGGLGRLLRWSALAGLVAFALPASAQVDRPLDGAAFSREALDRAAWSDVRDTPIFLSGRLQAADGSAPDAAALRFLRDNDALLGLVGGSAAEIVETRRDELAHTHVRVQQTVRGVPVWGAQSAVHLDPDGAVYAWGGDVHPEAAALRSTTPSLSAAAAIARAEGALEPGTVFRTSNAPDGLSADAPDWTPDARLVIYPADGIYALAYHVRLFVEAPQPANWEVFVDARSGLILHRFNSLHTFDPALDRAEARARATSPLLNPEALVATISRDGATTGTGASLFGGSYTLPTYLYQGAYYLYDTTRGPQYIRTMTGSNTTSLPGSYVTDSNNSFPASAAVDAHYGAVTTFDYFKTTHGRSSYNGNNAAITSTVNHRSGYNNAFWNGQQMVYGDGDGTTFIPLVSLDIAAHELTHAVTGTSAGLIYQNESGALNEAVSDIMAVMVDRDDYLIGEQSYTPGTSGDALRYLDDPPRGDQPDHYADRYTGSQDNGGVHINSGIANKQAYLLIAGGTFRGQAVQAIGRAKTERIWYRALVNYFTQSTNFAGAREGTIQAAADLYGAGSAEVASVTNAWAAVGVGSGSTGGGGGGGGTPEWRYETVTIESPHNYPNNYNNTKTYTKAGAQRVAMYFERFELESRYDYVYIKDASGATTASYTGTKSAFWAVVDGPSIAANLVSDYSVTRYGYRVSRVAYFSDQVLFGIDGEADGTPMEAPPAEASDAPALAAASKAVPFGLAVGPNPFRGRSTVFVSLDAAADVRVSVLDLLGREVALVEQGAFEPGVREVALDAAELPAGVYTVVLDADGRRQTQRITVLR